MLSFNRVLAPAIVATTLAAGTAASAFTACQVTDTGGIDDNSFNQTAWKGVLDAQETLGVEGRFLESQAETDYVANINSLVNGNCDIIITVGFLLGDATAAAAAAPKRVSESALVKRTWPSASCSACASVSTAAPCAAA